MFQLLAFIVVTTKHIKKFKLHMYRAKLKLLAFYSGVPNKIAP